MLSPDDVARALLVVKADKWFWGLIGSTIVLLIGVIMEEVHPLDRLHTHNVNTRTRMRTPRMWIIRAQRAYTKLAFVLVIGGIAGEGFCEFFGAKAESAVRNFDNQIAIKAEAAAQDAVGDAARAKSDARTAGEMEQALSLDVAQSDLVLAAQASRQRFSLFGFNGLVRFRRPNIELAVNQGSDDETKWFAQELTKGFKRLGWRVSTLKSCVSNDRKFRGTTIFNRWVTTGGAQSSDPSSFAMLASFQAASKEGMTMKDGWRINEMSWAIDPIWEKAPYLDENTFCIEVAEAPERWR